MLDIIYDIAKKLDALGPNRFTPSVPAATGGSVARINEHFGFELPNELVQLSKRCKYFSEWFLSIGPDFSNYSHIVRVNSYWRRRRRTRRVDSDLILFTDGHDEKYWGFDISVGQQPYPVKFWCPEEIIYLSTDKPILQYDSFSEYLRGLVKWQLKE